MNKNPYSEDSKEIQLSKNLELRLEVIEGLMQDVAKVFDEQRMIRLHEKSCAIIDRVDTLKQELVNARFDRWGRPSI